MTEADQWFLGAKTHWDEGTRNLPRITSTLCFDGGGGGFAGRHNVYKSLHCAL